MPGQRPFQGLIDLLRLVRQPQAKYRAKPAAGLHPTDARGQYVSPKPTSKRNRAATWRSSASSQEGA